MDAPPATAYPTAAELFDLSGRVAIVTGGAGGLGRAIAAGLASTGARGVLADLDADAAEATRAALDPDAAASLGGQTDVTNRASIESMLAATLERFGRVDGLLNSAGITQRMAAEEFSDEMWDR